MQLVRERTSDGRRSWSSIARTIEDQSRARMRCSCSRDVRSRPSLDDVLSSSSSSSSSFPTSDLSISPGGSSLAHTHIYTQRAILSRFLYTFIPSPVVLYDAVSRRERQCPMWDKGETLRDLRGRSPKEGRAAGVTFGILYVSEDQIEDLLLGIPPSSPRVRGHLFLRYNTMRYRLRGPKTQKIDREACANKYNAILYLAHYGNRRTRWCVLGELETGHTFIRSKVRKIHRENTKSRWLLISRHLRKIEKFLTILYTISLCKNLVIYSTKTVIYSYKKKKRKFIFYMKYQLWCRYFILYPKFYSLWISIKLMAGNIYR